MAIRTFNSVGGFSVGETPETIILANGDITTDFGTFTANVAAGNILSDHLLHADGTPWDFVTAGGNVSEIQFNDGGDLGGIANLTFNKSTKTLTLTGTANIANINTSNIVSDGNITAPYFIGNVVGNISGTLSVPGNDKAVLYNESGAAGASDSLKFNYSTNVLTLAGNIVTNNANLGNLTVANYFKGDGSLLTSINGSNVSEVPTANYAAYANYAIYSDGAGVIGNVSQAVHSYYSDIANSVAGANVSGNVAQAAHAWYSDVANSVAGANVSGNVSQAVHSYYSDIANSVAGANVSGNVSQAAHAWYSDVANSVTGANVSGQVSNALIAGTVYTNAQPNITSVGTLTSLTVTGLTTATGGVKTANIYDADGTLTLQTKYNTNAGDVGITGNLVVGTGGTGNISATNGTLTGTGTLGNLSVTNRVTSNLIPSTNDTNYLGNSSYAWAELNVTNVNIGSTYIRSTGSTVQVDGLFSASAANVASLTSRGDSALQGNVTVTGNLTVGGTTTYVNSTNTSIKDPILDLGGTNNGGDITNYDGKDRGLVLHNYYSNGFGPLNQFIGWDTSLNEFALGGDITVFGEVVTFNQYANIHGNAFVGNLTGTVLQASQTNITTVGTLTNLMVDGNLQVNASATLNSLTAGGLSYPTADGSAGQVLTTYGNGVVYFKTISTSSLTNGTSNVNVVNNGNVNISSGGVANVLTVTSTGANINGTLNSTGTATVGVLAVGNTTVQAYTKTTSSTSKVSIIAIDSATARAVEFFVKGEDSTGGKYSVATLSAVHDGSGNLDYSVYGTVILGGATGKLEVSIDLSGDISLDVTPASTNSTLWTVQYRTI